MPIIDDFEDADHDEYVLADGSSGSDKSDISFVTDVVHNGTYAMRVGNSGWRNYISHPDNTNLTSYLNYYPVRGDTIRFYTHCVSDNMVRVQFGVQDTTTRANCYSCRVNPRDSELQIRVRDAGSEIQTIGPDTTTVPAAVWIEVEISWTDDGSGNSAFSVVATNLSDSTEIVSFTGTDSTAIYTDGGLGLASVGDTAGDKLWDYIHTDPGTSTVSGVAQLDDGTTLENAKITGINDTTGEIEGTTTTDVDGNYSMEFSTGDEGHFLFEYDDGAGTTHQAASKPFIVPQ